MPDYRFSKELRTIAIDRITTSNPEIGASVFERSGSDANLLVAAAASMGESVSAQIALAVKNLHLITANGEDLDLIVFDRFGLHRKSASGSVGTLSFSRPNATFGATTVPIGTKCKNIGSPSFEFETLETASFGAADVGPILVSAVCTTTGVDTNVKASSVTKISGSLDDTSITVTNSSSFAGGSDEETDESLRQRGLNWFVAQRRGTIAAIEEGAKLVSTVADAVAVEVTGVDNVSPSGQVDLILSGGDGVGNSAMLEQFPGALDEWRPAGVYVRPVAGEIQYITINVNPSYKAGYQTASLRTQVKNALLSYTNSLSAGETWYLSEAYAAIVNIDGVLALQGTFVEPISDLFPANKQTSIKALLSGIKVNGK